jgi:hypothetical protein
MTIDMSKLICLKWWSGIFDTCPNWNTYLIYFGLCKSLEIPTHDLHCANNVIFNYKYDLVATKLFTATKDFKKTTKKHIGQTCKLHLVATRS